MLDIALSTYTVFIDVAYSRRGVSRNQPKHYAKYRGLDPRVLLFLLQSLESPDSRRICLCFAISSMMNGANGHLPQYKPTQEAQRILDQLTSCHDVKLDNIKFNNITFTSQSEEIYFPIPFKETETSAALKAVEAGLVAELSRMRYGTATSPKITIQLEKVACFLFATYIASIDGYRKLDPKAKMRLKDTDLLKAQSIPYRRMSANLYKTKEPGRFYHIHGSLEATKTLNMIGLEGHRPDLTEMADIVSTIESHVQKFTVSELETLNTQNHQAGVECMKHSDFLETPHGQIAQTLPPWKIETLETSTPPASFPTPRPGNEHRPLEGIRVLELCRIIAGPTIGKILAEYGADVLKVTSSQLSDVPFFQVDGNMSKHTTDLDLKSPEGRTTFEALLADADVVLDGYRPGAIARLGYGPQALVELGKKRGKGYVYVSENCFGYHGPWADRAGWQQIADCVSGVAWAQGEFLGHDYPVVPPFPMSDYGTGCQGAIAALTGLYLRARDGGSYHGKVSLLQYDLLLFQVGMYSKQQQEKLLEKFGGDTLRDLKYYDSVDHIGHTCLDLIEREHPELFGEEYQERWYSDKYGCKISVVKPVAEIEGLDVGFVRSSRPNGSDEATWNFGKDEGDRKLR
jgi:hypothetical protein